MEFLVLRQPTCCCK